MQITELEVWKAAIDLAKSCFEMSRKFPETEHYGLGYQLRRTVAIIPSNVAAAASRKHGKESLRHLFRARDLIYEVESHLYLSQKLEFISEEELNEKLELLNTAKRLLFGFIKYYKRAGNQNHGNRRRSNNNRSHHNYQNNDDSDLSDDFNSIDEDISINIDVEDTEF